jgi:lipopolysaccharide/colanic/teichoic acid biosynthesis glycosyltransferase
VVNIVRGDMSFVGARPVTEVELTRYGADADKCLSD